MWDFMVFKHVCVCFLTFNHDHVDIYGANRRLGQTLPFLQYVWDFSCGDAIVRLASECHQLPNGHSWRMWGEGRKAGHGEKEKKKRQGEMGG